MYEQLFSQQRLHIVETGSHCQGSHIHRSKAGIAARVDPGKRRQIHRNVERHAMISTTVTAYLQSQRRNLGALPRPCADIDAVRAMLALTSEIIRRQRIDDRLFDLLHEFAGEQACTWMVAA